jgi:hypothetical protein
MEVQALQKRGNAAGNRRLSCKTGDQGLQTRRKEQKMSATLDISMAKTEFCAFHLRQPYVFEYPMLVQLTMMAGFMLTPDEYVHSWCVYNGVNEADEFTYKDEFSMMGCLDS